jgi:hypothetical protein
VKYEHNDLATSTFILAKRLLRCLKTLMRRESGPQVAIKYRTGSDSDRTQLPQRPSLELENDRQRSIGGS